MSEPGLPPDRASAATRDLVARDLAQRVAPVHAALDVGLRRAAGDRARRGHAPGRLRRRALSRRRLQPVGHGARARRAGDRRGHPRASSAASTTRPSSASPTSPASSSPRSCSPPRRAERWLTRVFYAGDGASAVEAAIKMAFQAKAQRGEDRPLYLHVAEGYHGDTLGAVSVGGIDLFHHTYRPILLDTAHGQQPRRAPPGQSAAERAAEVLAEPRALLAREGHRVCAIVVEPLVQAAAGMLTHDASFLRGMRDARRRARRATSSPTRSPPASAAPAVSGPSSTPASCPTSCTCGKGLTAGYLPLSAVLATEEVYESFLGTPAERSHVLPRPQLHRQPAVRAAAIANLDLMAARDTVAHAAHVGDRIGELTAGLAAYDGVVRDPPDRHDDRHRGAQRSASAPASRSPRWPARAAC